MAASAPPPPRRSRGKALDYYLLGKRSNPDRQDEPPVERIDLSDTRPLAEVRADETSDGGPRAGAESQRQPGLSTHATYSKAFALANRQALS